MLSQLEPVKILYFPAMQAFFTDPLLGSLREAVACRVVTRDRIPHRDAAISTAFDKHLIKPHAFTAKSLASDAEFLIDTVVCVHLTNLQKSVETKTPKGFAVPGSSVG